VAGGALFSFVLVRFLDHIALLAVPALLNLAAVAWFGRQGGEAIFWERRRPRPVGSRKPELAGETPAFPGTAPRFKVQSVNLFVEFRYAGKFSF